MLDPKIKSILCAECNGEKKPAQPDYYLVSCPKCGEYEIARRLIEFFKSGDYEEKKPIFSIMAMRHWYFYKKRIILYPDPDIQEQLLKEFDSITDEEKINALPIYLFRELKTGQYLPLNDNIYWITASLNKEEFDSYVTFWIRKGIIEKSPKGDSITLSIDGRKWINGGGLKKQGRIGFIQD